MVLNLQTWLGENEKPQNVSVTKREIQNARIAMMRTGMKADEIEVEELSGNIVGKTEALKITVDPVIFRDLEFAIQTLEHEKAHKEGIKSEAMAELIASLKSGSEVAPEYKKAVQNLKIVTDVIGLRTAEDLYKQESYTWMFQIFVNQMNKRGVTYLECVTLFERAFPELEVQIKTH